jgi:hypothetical protein
MFAFEQTVHRDALVNFLAFRRIWYSYTLEQEYHLQGKEISDSKLDVDLTAVSDADLDAEVVRRVEAKKAALLQKQNAFADHIMGEKIQSVQFLDNRITLAFAADGDDDSITDAHIYVDENGKFNFALD